MITAIIELGVGYFVTYSVPGILGLKGLIATIVKVIGIILLLAGFVSLVQSVGHLLNLS